MLHASWGVYPEVKRFAAVPAEGKRPVGRRQARSNTAAIPCPPPMHIVTSA
jgi:hypothetical protein